MAQEGGGRMWYDHPDSPCPKQNRPDASVCSITVSEISYFLHVLPHVTFFPTLFTTHFVKLFSDRANVILILFEPTFFPPNLFGASLICFCSNVENVADLD